MFSSVITTQRLTGGSVLICYPTTREDEITKLIAKCKPINLREWEQEMRTTKTTYAMKVTWKFFTPCKGKQKGHQLGDEYNPMWHQQDQVYT